MKIYAAQMSKSKSYSAKRKQELHFNPTLSIDFVNLA